MKAFVRFLISKEGIISLLCYTWTGLFSFLSFAPVNLPFFVWISPFGLFWIERKYRGQWKKLIYHGFGFTVVFYTISFHWIYHMTTVFGGFDWYLAVIIFIGSGILLNLKFPVYLLLSSFLNIKVQRHFAWIVAFSILVAEWITPQIFPWYFGNVIAENVIVAQNAEYLSALGLSPILFFFAYGLFHHRHIWKWKVHLRRWYQFRPRMFKILQYKLLYLVVVVLVFGNGYYLYNKWSQVSPKGEREVLVIQPNAPLEFRDGRSVAETLLQLLARIDSLSFLQKQGSPIDLVVLPESGVPFLTSHETETTKRLGMYWARFEAEMVNLSFRHGANVFYNELDAELDPSSTGVFLRKNVRHFNSSVLMNPNGERRSSYQKVYLLIFGEYMPFEWMYALSGQTGRFEPGKKMDLIPYFVSRKSDLQSLGLRWEDLEKMSPDMVREHYKLDKIDEKEVGKFLPLICYEVIVPEFVRKFTGDPDFIVNVTNDKWYGNSVESYQHHTLGRLRSIEFRKWMVRSTNSGTSVFTNHLGENVDNEFTALDAHAVLRKSVQVIPGEMTFFRSYGHLLSYIFMGISLVVFAFYAKRAL